MQKGVPLHAIYYEWTYVEVMKANAVLDMSEAIEAARLYVEEMEVEEIHRSSRK